MNATTSAADGATVPSSSRVGDWEAARSHPHTYPGRCPSGSFVVVDDDVHPLRFDRPDDLSSLEVLLPDGPMVLDLLLADRGLAPVSGRIPVIAYGGNRNPGTIALKRQHYEHRSTGTGSVFPLLRARMRGVDVVAGGLSDQGYLYADLYEGPETTDTDIEVWVLLLDDEGLRTMHDSEGLQMGAYACARFDRVRVDGLGHEVGALAYAGELPVFVSPEHGVPLAFAAVEATGRTLPPMDPVAMLDHLIATSGLADRVRSLIGVDGDVNLGEQAMKFLNGQFWYRRHTLERRVESCEALEQLLWEGLLGSCHATTTAGTRRASGAVLATDAAYAPAAELTVGRWWAAR